MTRTKATWNVVVKNVLVRSVFANRTVPAVTVVRKMKNAGNIVGKMLKTVAIIIASITAGNIGITEGQVVVEDVVDSQSRSGIVPKNAIGPSCPCSFLQSHACRYGMFFTARFEHLGDYIC